MLKTTLAYNAALLLVACCFASAQSCAAKAAPCQTHNAPEGWQPYVDRVHGFCFWYPPIYKRIANKVRVKNLVTFQRLDAEASLFIQADDKPFDLQGFVVTAPTGYLTPPGPIHVGHYTFYYYGPGGGGVQYADRYFFNLRGKTLCITFDGPYVNDKTPSEETKKLESEILATFSVLHRPRPSPK